MSLTFLTGGARSGKSARAVLMARRSERDVTFVATAQPRDSEMTERIRLHQAERPSSWTTLEAPVDLGPVISGLPVGDVGIIDCLSLWVSNLMERGESPEAIQDAAQAAARACADSASSWILVSNEVGLGLVPMHPVGREYRDVLGRVNATVARHASLVQLLVSGRAITLEDDLRDLPRSTAQPDPESQENP